MSSVSVNNESALSQLALFPSKKNNANRYKLCVQMKLVWFFSTESIRSASVVHITITLDSRASSMDWYLMKVLGAACLSLNDKAIQQSDVWNLISSYKTSQSIGVTESLNFNLNSYYRTVASACFFW